MFFVCYGGYYLFGLSGVRQALATAIFVFSIPYIGQRKAIMAFVLVPCFLNLVSKRRNRFIMEALLIAAFIVYWVYVYFLHNAEGVLPYQSIFS